MQRTHNNRSMTSIGIKKGVPDDDINPKFVVNDKFFDDVCVGKQSIAGLIDI